MRRTGRRAVAVLFAAAIIVSLCGCKKNGGIRFTTGLKDKELFRLEDEVCTRQEAMVFVLSQKARYEKAYGTGIWEVQIEGEAFSDYMRHKLQDFLARLKCMTLMASEYEVELSEEETIKVSQAADAYMEGLSPKALEASGIKKEHAETVFHDYCLANKLVEILTADASAEISEDEARVIFVQQVFLSTEGLDAAEKERKRSLASAVREEALEGTDFSALSRKYNEGGASEFELCRGEAGARFEEAAFALSAGEISKVVETDYGFHVIRCADNYDEKKTADHKKELAERMKAERFFEYYDEFVETVAAEYNEKAWNSMDYRFDCGTGIVDFYEIYSQYFRE